MTVFGDPSALRGFASLFRSSALTLFLVALAVLWVSPADADSGLTDLSTPLIVLGLSCLALALLAQARERGLVRRVESQPDRRRGRS